MSDSAEPRVEHPSDLLTRFGNLNLEPKLEEILPPNHGLPLEQASKGLLEPSLSPELALNPEKTSALGNASAAAVSQKLISEPTQQSESSQQEDVQPPSLVQEVLPKDHVVRENNPSIHANTRKTDAAPPTRPTAERVASVAAAASVASARDGFDALLVHLRHQASHTHRA